MRSTDKTCPVQMGQQIENELPEYREANSRHECSDFLKSLKGYSGVSLIHGLNHCETVLDQVSRPLIYGVLSTSEFCSFPYALSIITVINWQVRHI